MSTKTKVRVVRPRGLGVYKIEVDDEELRAIIDFQWSAANDATDSCEFDEARERRERRDYLQSLL